MPSYSFDTELDDETIGRALSSPLFIQEREEPADRRQAYHSFEESFVASSVLLCLSCKNEETRALNEEKINHTFACELRRDQQLLQEQLSEQNRDLREAHMKSLNEVEELKRFQGSTFDTIARRKLVEDRRHYP